MADIVGPEADDFLYKVKAAVAGPPLYAEYPALVYLLLLWLWIIVSSLKSYQDQNVQKVNVSHVTCSLVHWAEQWICHEKLIVKSELVTHVITSPCDELTTEWAKKVRTPSVLFIQNHTLFKSALKEVWKVVQGFDQVIKRVQHELQV